jgi:hypothetical protein
MVNTKPILGDMRLNVTDNLRKYEVFNGETWVIMENYDTIESLRAQNSKLQTDLDIALSYIKQYELQIKELKQQVAFLEDWRDTWSPTIKQLMNINVKVNDGN